VLSALIEVAGRERHDKLLSRVFPKNAASRSLPRSLGFQEIGMHRRLGQLDRMPRVERLISSGRRE
jgi:L-amino acid N-acyltransferase YncA